MLLLQKILAGLDERALGHQTHNLGAGDADAPCLGAAAHLVEGLVQRRDVDVGDVHRHLCDAILIDEPSYGLGLLQRTGNHDGVALGILHGLAHDGVALAAGTSFLPHVEGDGVGPTGGGGVQVEVHGDKEVAGAHHGASRTGDVVVVGTAAEIGLLAGCGEFLGDALILAGAAYGQVAPLLGVGGGLVAIARYAQFVGNALGQLACQFGAFLQGDAAHGDEGQHIGGADTRVCPVVLAHVDHLSGFAHGAECGFHHGVGVAHEGDDGAVGGLARVDVEQAYAFGLFYLL